MKITSINVVQPEEVILHAKRNTERAKNVREILEFFAKNSGAREIALTGEQKKSERYALQKALQRAGAHVTVHDGTSAKTGKTMLVVRRLTDAEWKEYLSK
jgi:hypothetical protein